jgi:ubiquinone biosynthesis protein UbiJ
MDLLTGLNFAIERDEDLHQHLKSLAGRRVAVRFLVPGPWEGQTLEWAFAADGLLESMARARSAEGLAKVPDVTLGLTSAFFGSAITQVVSGKPTAASSFQGVRIEGDAAVAEQLGPLLAIFKERLDPVRLLIASSPAASMAKKAVDYAIHDAGWVVTREEFALHTKEVRGLRDAIDRLEKRILGARQPNVSS